MATLVIVAFFAALPAWFLSTREGWIAVDCVRRSDGTTVDCRVHERFAFSSRDATYSTLGAHVERRGQHDRHGTTSTFQLVLVTAAGEQPVLRDHTGNDALAQAAAELDAAARSRATEFHAAVSPDLVFWLAVALLGVFAGAGMLIALTRGARGRKIGGGEPAHDDPSPAQPPRARVVHTDRGGGTP